MPKLPHGPNPRLEGVDPLSFDESTSAQAWNPGMGMLDPLGEEVTIATSHSPHTPLGSSRWGGGRTSRQIAGGNDHNKISTLKLVYHGKELTNGNGNNLKPWHFLLR